MLMLVSRALHARFERSLVRSAGGHQGSLHTGGGVGGCLHSTFPGLLKFCPAR